MTYEEYINSSQWKDKRLRRLRKDKFRCRTCWNEDNLQVHHLTYERLGHEEIDDLITLCRECHEAITNVIRGRRYDNSDINFSDNQERVRLDYVEAIRSEIDWSITPDNAQWTTSESPQSSSNRDKKSIWQTLED